jgi:hypothetical protein
MRDVEEILKDICDKRAELEQIEDRRVELLKTTLSPALRDELDQTYQKYTAIAKEQVEASVSELVRWPPHKVGHFAELKQFLARYQYEKSVFIMTKYPADPPGALDLELGKVIKAVRDAIEACGYTSHLASDATYQPGLFDNIELYMLGCSRAIAIVESKHTAELNPNVTMEWGWLRCTDRKVLSLIEKDFDRERADIGGLIKEKFDWNNPEPGINSAVQKFLKL